MPVQPGVVKCLIIEYTVLLASFFFLFVQNRCHFTVASNKCQTDFISYFTVIEQRRIAVYNAEVKCTDGKKKFSWLRMPKLSVFFFFSFRIVWKKNFEWMKNIFLLIEWTLCEWRICPFLVEFFFFVFFSYLSFELLMPWLHEHRICNNFLRIHIFYVCFFFHFTRSHIFWNVFGWCHCTIRFGLLCYNDVCFYSSSLQKPNSFRVFFFFGCERLFPSMRIGIHSFESIHYCW